MLQYEATFTKEELRANLQNKSKLIDFISSGDAILMAGAGCSGSLYPGWNGFVDLLESEAMATDANFQEDKTYFLPFADKVKECLGGDHYYSIIYDTFRPQEPTHERFHETLCKLPFKAITTTNYDIVLESALNVIKPYASYSLHFEGTTKNKIREFLLSLNYNKNLPKRVAHLHGIYDVYESIVLGGKEYLSKYGFSIYNSGETLYEEINKGNFSKEQFHDLLYKYGYEWPLRRKLLWSLLATRRIFFIGFSMADPYFLQMLEFVKDDLSTYNAETHFLLLRVTPKSFESDKGSAKRLKAEYGIETVFFLDEDGDYSGLARFISELDDAINVPEVTSRKIVEEVSPITFSGDPALTNYLFELSKKQNLNENQ